MLHLMISALDRRPRPTPKTLCRVARALRRTGRLPRRGALLIPLVMFGVAATATAGLQVQSSQGVATVTHDGRPVLEYRCEAHPMKLYVSRLYTPGGVQVLRDSPEDHVHHHALMYAVGIDQVDFWSEESREKNGRQVSEQFGTGTTQSGQGRGRAVLRQELVWKSPKDAPLAREIREITVHFGDVPDAHVLTWEFSLSPAKSRSSIKLWGQHYFGLGMRFVVSMDEGSEFLNAADRQGVVVRGSEKLTYANWCAVHGNANGKPVTIAMFDAPDNPRHPARWFTMTEPFAYLAATMNLHEQPLEVSEGKPLKARYGIVAWDGTIDRQQIERAYQSWLRRDGE